MLAKSFNDATKAIQKDASQKSSEVVGAMCSARTQSSALVNQMKSAFDVDHLTKAGADASSRENQVIRKHARSDLVKFCAEHVKQMESMLVVQGQPQNVLQDAEDKVLGKLKAHEDAIRSFMDRAQQSTREAKQEFSSKNEMLLKLRVDFGLDLDQLRPIHTFLINIIGKVMAQKAEEAESLQKVLDKELVKLESQLDMFVKADDSPTKNNTFAAVIQRIGHIKSRKQGIEDDHAGVELKQLHEQLAILEARIKVEDENASSKRQKTSLGGYLASWLR